MTALLFALFLVFMLLGVPIALAIGASTLVALNHLWGTGLHRQQLQIRSQSQSFQPDAAGPRHARAAGLFRWAGP
mgnify:CR=1 FL=1